VLWNILLVEDDRISARYFTHMLSGANYRITVAPTCEQARALACSGHFSLVVVDHELPDGDGVELTRWLRRCPQLENVPIIMCTASDDESTLRASFEAGVTDFMRKPLRLTELKVRVQSAIKLHEATLNSWETLSSASLANVVSVLAHEINNPLAVAYYCTERLQEEHPEGADRAGLLRRGLDRIRSLVADLRVLALTEESSVEWISLQQTLRLASRILCVRNSGRLSVRGEIAEDVQVHAHPGMLGQAIVSLGNHLLDHAELQGGGSVQFGAERHGDEVELGISLRLAEIPGELTPLQVGPEPPQVILSRRHLAQFGAQLSAVSVSATELKLVIRLACLEPVETQGAERNEPSHV
jgi:CheY-like chemotaxis protein